MKRAKEGLPKAQTGRHPFKPTGDPLLHPVSPLHTVLQLQGLCTFELPPTMQALDALDWDEARPAAALALEGAVGKLFLKVRGLGRSGLGGR